MEGRKNIEKTYEIKENNLTNIKIETDDKIKTLDENRNKCLKVIIGLMFSCFSVLILVPVIVLNTKDISCMMQFKLSFEIIFGYSIFTIFILSIISLIFMPGDSVKRIYNIQQKLENSEQFSSIIFTRLKEDEIENWDKDYILLKTEVDEKNRTANIKVYVPYNSLLLL